MSSTEPLTVEDLPSTSYVLNNIDKALRPKEAVACMNCPLAVWMLKDKILECYCRTLYMTVWETHKPGKIRMCDAPEQVRQVAEATEVPAPTRLAPQASSFNQESQSFGLLDLAEGMPVKQASEVDFKYL